VKFETTRWPLGRHPPPINTYLFTKIGHRPPARGSIAIALDSLPDGTILDGELVALGSDGRLNFNLLQNFRCPESSVVHYAFDSVVHKGRDIAELPLWERRRIGAARARRLVTFAHLQT
jgi:ATP-dependent DNA ligase